MDELHFRQQHFGTRLTLIDDLAARFRDNIAFAGCIGGGIEVGLLPPER
jgi:hypothetical protein